MMKNHYSNHICIARYLFDLLLDNSLPNPVGASVWIPKPFVDKISCWPEGYYYIEKRR